jgi:hypothetical protein
VSTWAACCGALAAVLSGCTERSPATNCGAGSVLAKVGSRDIPLASCAGGVGVPTSPIRITAGDSIAVVIPNEMGARAFELATDDSGVVRIHEREVVGKMAGSANITATGLTCANQESSCVIFQVVVDER